MIYLASGSPRRADLLRQISVPFEVVTPEVDETPHAAEESTAYVSRLAVEKARQGALLVLAAGRPQAPVLGADTAVVMNGQVFGKPADRAQARRMLQTLSGQRHDVLTAIALMHFPAPGEMAQFGATTLVTTRVVLDPLSDREIEAYLATGEPEGKAGGYAIQGLAARYVARIEGSYTGVVGLPVREVARLLAALEEAAHE